MNFLEENFEEFESILDFDHGNEVNEIEHMNYNKFEDAKIKPYIASYEDFVEWTKKGLVYIGAECDEKGNFIRHCVIPIKELTMHFFLFAISGAGKTEMQKFLYTNLLIHKDIAQELNLSNEYENKIDFFDVVIIDNLGNFNGFGEPVLQSNKYKVKDKEMYFLEYWIGAGWKPSYLRQLGHKHIIKLRPNNQNKIGMWKTSSLTPELETTRTFIEYLDNLGSEITGMKGFLYDVLDCMDLVEEDNISKDFDMERFYSKLINERNDALQQGRFAVDNERKQLYELAAKIDGVIEPLKKLKLNYGEVFTNSNIKDNKFIIQSCQGCKDKWLFNASLLFEFYIKYVAKEENRQGIKAIVSTDEYNDALDASLNDVIKGTQDSRERNMARFIRSFFLMVWREGRNFGCGFGGATQNPGQLQIKEGKKLANINTKFAGYMGTEIDKMIKNDSGGTTFGEASEVINKESDSKNGWIGQKHTGRWIMVRENRPTYLQTFIAPYN